jgi:hypothetical protein
MIQEEYLIKYCVAEIIKAKNETRNKTHLRYRGRLEAFIEVLKIITKDKITHCESCGEWLKGFDQCSQCGRINK